MSPLIQQELNEIKKLIKDNFFNDKEVLTGKELISYLNISYSLLSKLSAAGIIPSHQPTNGLKYYFKSEIHDTGKGKSILSVQLAESVASEKMILNIYISLLKPMLFDFELSANVLKKIYCRK